MTTAPAAGSAATAAATATGWPQLTGALIAGEDLGHEQTAWAMNQVMSGNASPVQIAGFLVALRAKGETVDELTGLVEEMLRHAVRIQVPGPAVDVVGTGGDRHHTVNVSTMASLVVAGAGRRVVKHGNRAASSASGAADVLEALGVRLDLPPERVAALATEVGVTFCFAAAFHPAMRHAGPVRAELKLPTAFNFLGPLTNPAQPHATALGVADARMAPIMAGVIARRGHSALVFRGEDGLDELAATAPAQLWEVRDGTVTTHRIDARQLGLPPVTLADLRGGDAAHNADVVRRVLAGETGPVRDTVLLNAAAALVAADAAEGRADGSLEDRLVAALARAAESVDSGAAKATLERWIAASAA